MLKLAPELVGEGVQMSHVTRRIRELVIGEQHGTPVGAAVVRGVRHAEVAMEALVEVVAGLGAGRQETRGGERAEHAGGTQPALHPQPEQVELRVVGDDFHGFERGLQLAEIVAGGAEVDDPGLPVLDAKREEANVARPGIEAVAFSGAVGFDIERNGAGCANGIRNSRKTFP